MPHLPERSEVHREIRNDIEGSRSDIKGIHVQTATRRLREPCLMTRFAEENRYEDEDCVEDGVKDVQALKYPVKGVPLLRAEDAQHKKYNGDLSKSDCGAVNHVGVVVKLLESVTLE